MAGRGDGRPGDEFDDEDLGVVGVMNRDRVEFRRAEAAMRRE
jgi:hypothetical protein